MWRMRKSNLLSAAALFVSFVLAAWCFQREGWSFPEAKSVRLDSEFGSLRFAGEVQILTAAEHCHYNIPALEVTFRHQPPNMLDRIHLTNVRMVVVGRNGSNQLFEMLVQRTPIAVAMDAANPIGRISDLNFSVAISTIDAAEYVGFAASDGRLGWPISARGNVIKQIPDENGEHGYTVYRSPAPGDHCSDAKVR